ncbi:MAG: hypothetical protein M1820_000737 [Bogoriella megaspora]|nr:MAG: hypothetical protein M1820_000737 [Bogoriella megaspora]
MHHQHLLSILLAIASVSAIPLNINLGAYSPALVVGDGEISFSGTDGAGNLIEELESGAVSAASQNGQAPAATEGAIVSPGSEASLVGPSESLPSSTTESVTSAEATATETSASETATSTSESETPARAIKLGVDPSGPRPNMERRSSNTPVRRSPSSALNSALQLTESQRNTYKRDLAGFREALNYAITAMKNQPKIEEGTENAGVGIIVNPGLNVPQGSAAAGTPPPSGKVKRDVEAEKAGITLLAIAEI